MEEARTLVIMRHAKAANPERTADAERPLTTRGHADAAAAGPWLRQHGYLPDLVLCSPAARARQTWQALALTSEDVRFERGLYAATALDLLDRVTEVEDEARMVLLVGHNPALSQLSVLLDPTGGDGDLRTNGVAVHAAALSWRAWGPGTAPLTDGHTARA